MMSKDPSQGEMTPNAQSWPSSPVSSSLISTLRLVLAALGFATVSLFWLLKPGVDSSQRAYYHWHHHPADLALSTAIDLLTFTAALAFLFYLFRAPGRLRVALWGGLLLFLPWIIFENTIAVLMTTRVVMPTRKESFALFFGAFLLSAILTAAWKPSWSPRFENVISSATTILVFAGIFGCFLLSRLAWYGSQAGNLAALLPLHQRQDAASIQPHRIFWIVFDELSYDQVYQNRFPGLTLPAFDSLAQQATSFTQVTPPDIQTQIILPGLLSGKAWDDIRTPANGQLWVDHRGTWTKFDQHDTVLQDALNSGYSTAAAGWYIPYCRIAPAVLDQCFTSFRDTLSNNMVTSGPVLGNAIKPFYLMDQFFLSPLSSHSQIAIQSHTGFPGFTMQVADLHIKDYQDLYAESDRLIRDRSAGFVFLHLPIPHPYGIFNRTTGQFLTAKAHSKSTYVDNLALADQCLAGLRSTLEQTGQWNSSTVVVMGDHGWRAGLWQAERQFLREEVTASHNGRYDHRPVYLVKLPNQATGANIDTPFQAVNTRKLFDEILMHTIETPTQLTAWASSTR